MPVRQPPMPASQPPMPVRQPPMPVRQPPMPVRQPPMPVRNLGDPLRLTPLLIFRPVLMRLMFLVFTSLAKILPFFHFSS